MVQTDSFIQTLLDHDDVAVYFITRPSHVAVGVLRGDEKNGFLITKPKKIEISKIYGMVASQESIASISGRYKFLGKYPDNFILYYSGDLLNKFDIAETESLHLNDVGEWLIFREDEEFIESKCMLVSKIDGGYLWRALAGLREPDGVYRDITSEVWRADVYGGCARAIDIVSGIIRDYAGKTGRGK